jgi:quercetin dioxygenase-like cupin family protein
MKIAWMPMLGLLLSTAAAAQSPAPAPSDVRKDIQIDIQNPIKPESAVPLKAEPHHVLVFQNDYVHVFNVTVPPLDVTLLHQHDLPYIYLTLGTADVFNAVVGKPEAHLMLEDGATRYSPGSFAHLVRTDAGVLFHNITIELARPQGSPRNLGDKGADRPLGSCAQSGADTKQNGQVVFEQVLPCVETDELRMDLVSVAGGKDFAQASPETAALLIAMTNANLDVSLGGQHDSFLHVGDVLWLPAGTARKVVDLLGIQSQFLLISFKDSGSAAAK